jgi:hypothetical protein
MLTTFTAWRWLDAYCPFQIRHALGAREHGIAVTSWIARLACDVAGVLERRTTQHSFDPATYGLAIQSASFKFTSKRGTILVNQDELILQVIYYTTRIIASWLNFPTHGVSR